MSLKNEIEVRDCRFKKTLETRTREHRSHFIVQLYARYFPVFIPVFELYVTE